MDKANPETTKLTTKIPKTNRDNARTLGIRVDRRKLAFDSVQKRRQQPSLKKIQTRRARHAAEFHTIQLWH